MDNRNFELSAYRIDSLLIIVEGCDCTGKTSFIKALREILDANWNPDEVDMVHHGSYHELSTGLARMSVESALSAITGKACVLMDRGLLSENVYSPVYRNVPPRMDLITLRMIHRIFMRANFALVICDPGWPIVEQTYCARKDFEYVQGVDNIQKVYKAFRNESREAVRRDYADQSIVYDYTINPDPEVVIQQLLSMTTRGHYPRIPSGGNWDASVVIVGDYFDEVGNQDPWYQVPFVGFSLNSCARWITEHLEEGCVLERELMWVNADQLLDEETAEKLLVRKYPDQEKIARLIIALGDQASRRLVELGHDHVQLQHPRQRMWSESRVESLAEYPLAKTITKFLMR